jgi:hypothetical protein
MMWRSDVMLDVKSYSKYHIDAWVTEVSVDGRAWRFTSFYGDPSRTSRKESWRMLRFLRNETDLPWLCAGDFNEILHEHEHFGGNGREEWMMEGFRDVVSYCDLTDLGYNGLPYTWDNRREGPANVKVRLDRALMDGKMLDLFGDSSVTHVQSTESDHCALLIKLQRNGELQGRRSQRPFRYENMWRRHEMYNETVNLAWVSGCSSLLVVQENLNGMQYALKSWEKEQFGSARAEL